MNKRNGRGVVYTSQTINLAELKEKLDPSRGKYAGDDSVYPAQLKLYEILQSQGITKGFGQVVWCQDLEHEAHFTNSNWVHELEISDEDIAALIDVDLWELCRKDPTGESDAWPRVWRREGLDSIRPTDQILIHWPLAEGVLQSVKPRENYWCGYVDVL